MKQVFPVGVFEIMIELKW